MLKRYLLAPGPTPVPPEVLLAMARPMIHHRAPEFDKLFAEVREDSSGCFKRKTMSSCWRPPEPEAWKDLCLTFSLRATKPSPLMGENLASDGQSYVRPSARR